MRSGVKARRGNRSDRKIWGGPSQAPVGNKAPEAPTTHAQRLRGFRWSDNSFFPCVKDGAGDGGCVGMGDLRL